LRPLVEADIPVFHIHGDVDTVVPLAVNSAELAQRYIALGGKARVKVVPGKGHEEVDEFFTDPDFLAFILSRGTKYPELP
jgi:predicted esterase